MKTFHRLVFKGQSMDDVIAQARAHLMQHHLYDLVAKLEESRSMLDEPSTSGFTEFYGGKLEPLPYNEGHTHFVRVKWYGSL